MNTKLLIDAIVRRTTVLIAQLSTAAGIRAPLAHVADQVFIELAKELEAQGLGKKVVADMFGMALRGYQKKIQRLEGSATVRDRTLWEAVLDFVRDQDGVTRKRLLERFSEDDNDAVGSVLRDLVSSGLVLTSGYGTTSFFRATSEADLRNLRDAESAESLATMAWAVVYHHPGIDLAVLAEHLSTTVETLGPTVKDLHAEGRLESRDPATWSGLQARTLLIPLGAEVGWEGAVYDHFQAVADAVAAKLRLGSLKAEAADRVGGTTLHFEIGDGHPFERDVYGLLADVRRSTHGLWERVCEHNEEHPLLDEEKIRVSFYFGQNVVAKEAGEEE